MIKTLTGRELTAIEYRPLSKCLECGYAIDSEYDKCISCIQENRNKCSYCEIVLKDGIRTTYQYDNNDNLREDNIDFKSSKNLIREFKIEGVINYPKHDDAICQECFEIKENIKKNYLRMNFCVGYGCGKSLLREPTVENMTEYLGINGMYCKSCLYDIGIFPELFNNY